LIHNAIRALVSQEERVMSKLFEIVPRRGSWDVLHNHVGFRMCPKKRDAIRLALTLGRLQQRRGEEAEIVLRDGGRQIRHRIPADSGHSAHV
jgi:hypothetical protein